MTRRPWTPADLRLLRSIYPHCHSADVAALLARSASSTNCAAHTLGLRKSAAYMAADIALRRLRGLQHPAIRAAGFQPGLAPWNKGRKGWQAGGASVRTQFVKGSRPHGWRAVGSTRIGRDGYLRHKVSDTGNKLRDWPLVHHTVWQAAHGPAPAGHVVAFKPGRHSTDPARITLDALECIHRAELARRNHPRNASPELARLYQLKGAITRQVNRIARQAQGATA